MNFGLLHKRTIKKSAHKKDHNYEPFVKNETINKRVPKNRFINLLVTADVLGHILWTFFEKVHKCKKGSYLWTDFMNQSEIGS